jgi:hypothetical protein
MQRIQPDEQRAAGIDGGTRSTTQGLGHCAQQQKQQGTGQLNKDVLLLCS